MCAHEVCVRNANVLHNVTGSQLDVRFVEECLKVDNVLRIISQGFHRCTKMCAKKS